MGAETRAENFPGQRNCSTAVAPHLVHGRTDVQSRSERIGGCHHASDVVSAQLPRRPFAANPEQLFVAALSACQALTYLVLAAKNQIAVVDYTTMPKGDWSS